MYKHREKCSCKEPYRNEVADTGEHHEAECPRGIQLRAEKKATESPVLKRVMDFGQEGAKRQNAPYGKMDSSKTARVWFSIVTESDAKALCKWWNGHGSFAAYYTYQTSAANPRFFDVMRNPVTTDADRDKWWSRLWSGHEERLS